jgi:ABC-type branched-subunit amino acid transport system permease subunit
MGRWARPAGWVGVFIVLLAAGAALPDWTVFLSTVALAKGLTILGLVILMRAGLVSFGQGLFFAVGAYATGFVGQVVASHDIVLTLLAGGIAAGLVAAVVGVLMVQYREIFFAMLSLAFSMIFYGVLVKNQTLGGTDGFNIPPPTFLGFASGGAALRLTLYGFTLAVCAAVGAAAHRYATSTMGYLAHAIRDNEVRVEYLGASVRRAIYVKYVLAGGLGGMSGALVALAVGHIDPQTAYWTTSGEFVFVALLGGTGSVLAPLLGSVVFEFARSYAYTYSPYTWQLALGLVMLAVILFLPKGLWSLPELWARARAE